MVKILLKKNQSFIIKNFLKLDLTPIIILQKNCTTILHNFLLIFISPKKGIVKLIKICLLPELVGDRCPVPRRAGVVGPGEDPPGW